MHFLTNKYGSISPLLRYSLPCRHWTASAKTGLSTPSWLQRLFPELHTSFIFSWKICVLMGIVTTPRCHSVARRPVQDSGRFGARSQQNKRLNCGSACFRVSLSPAPLNTQPARDQGTKNTPKEHTNAAVPIQIAPHTHGWFVILKNVLMDLITRTAALHETTNSLNFAGCPSSFRLWN